MVFSCETFDDDSTYLESESDDCTPVPFLMKIIHDNDVPSLRMLRIEVDYGVEVFDILCGIFQDDESMVQEIWSFIAVGIDDINDYFVLNSMTPSYFCRVQRFNFKREYTQVFCGTCKPL